MKRTRSHQVSFRLNDKEYALLQRKLAASGMSLTEFFIETISKGKEIVISDFVPLLSELKRQGVNLNQLTRDSHQRFCSSAVGIETAGRESQSAHAEDKPILSDDRTRDHNHPATMSEYEHQGSGAGA